jgi:hypothetical protein
MFGRDPKKIFRVRMLRATIVLLLLLISLAAACSDKGTSPAINVFEPQEYGEWMPSSANNVVGGINDDIEDEFPDDCSPANPIAVIRASHPARGEALADPSATLQVVPLDTIALDASLSYNPQSLSDPQNPQSSEISRIRWRIVEHPEGSTSDLEITDRMQSSIWMQLAGRYVIELDVWNDEGVQSCNSARLVLESRANQTIHIQLVWHTPDDPDETDELGADLDLHLLHPNAHGQWNDLKWDCNWQQPEPDWGRIGDSSDDPSLDIDDHDGAGPENINLDHPEPGSVYQIGVSYFSDHGFDVSIATLRVYINGALAFESVPIELTTWPRGVRHIADIAWPSGEVTAVDVP